MTLDSILGLLMTWKTLPVSKRNVSILLLEVIWIVTQYQKYISPGKILIDPPALEIKGLKLTLFDFCPCEIQLNFLER